MKHVIQIDAGIVVGGDAGKHNTVKTDGGQGSKASLDVLVDAIDLRANYIGPVLEDILQKTHGAWPWNLHE